MSPQNAQTPEALPLNAVLDDLCMRFLVNLPAVEYESFERLFFAIESAHWFYDDFYRTNNPTLPRLPLKAFAAKLFSHTDLLRHYRDDVDRLTAQFQSYKQEVPTCGAALLNPSMDKVVLVRAWGQNARWGFPKGKLSKDEAESDAAIREVLEETGFDASGRIDNSTFYVDSMSGGRYSRIFVVTDVPEDTVFETRTRKEISDIKWVPITDLPDSPKAAKVQHTITLISTGPIREEKVQKIFFSQFGVAPYTKRIRAWIKRRKKQTLDTCELAPSSTQDMDDTAVAESFGGYEGPSCPNGTYADHSFSTQQVSIPDKFISVEELEAQLLPPQSTVQKRRKSCKPKSKAGETAGKETRKSRRKAEEEEMRNRTTFGVESGARMNDSERDSLFRQYVLETDRIAAEKGLCDDLWPVPYVTSDDFTEEELKAAEEAHEKRNAKLREKAKELSSTSSQHEKPSSSRRVQMKALPREKETPFSFDRAAIMACINTVTSS